jgi:hypothetical protein
MQIYAAGSDQRGLRHQQKDPRGDGFRRVTDKLATRKNEFLRSRLAAASRDCARTTGTPEVIGSSVELVTRDALVLTGLSNFHATGSNRRQFDN